MLAAWYALKTHWAQVHWLKSYFTVQIFNEREKEKESVARFIRSYVAEIGTLEFCLPPQDPNSDAVGLKISTDQFKGMIKTVGNLVSVTFCLQLSLQSIGVAQNGVLMARENIFHCNKFIQKVRYFQYKVTDT